MGSTASSMIAARNAGKVLILAGPTGVGKTATSLALAKRLGKAEIISADSVQVYRGLDVGSRKLPQGEREGIVHHLLDVLDPKDQYSAGDFYVQAREKTLDILERGNTPIVVGGNGFWLRWYVQGRPSTPKSNSKGRNHAQQLIQQVLNSVDAELQDENVSTVEERKWEKSLELLHEAGDPETAHRLSKNDYLRLERALEIVLTGGKPMKSYLNTDDRLDYDFRCFFLYPKERHSLYRRLDMSCEKMAVEGLLQESLTLLRSGLMPGLSTSTCAVGYRQAMDYLVACNREARMDPKWKPEWKDFEQFLFAFQQQTRKYAQDQLTWFRNESLYKWIETNFEDDFETVVDQIEVDFHQPGWHSYDNNGMGYLSKQEEKLLKGYNPDLKIFSASQARRDMLEWIQLNRQFKSSL